MKTVRIIPIVVFFSFWIGNSLAQTAGEVKSITRMTGNVLLDGIVDEAGWSRIDPMPLTMHWPVFKGTVTEFSEIRVAYDDENIYVGAICYDSDPSGIQVTTFQRDNWGEEDDQVAIILDPYNDNENSMVFVVTVTGSRIDAVIKNDSQGDDPMSMSWNSYWEAVSTRDNRGWQAEMKIPFSSLRFQEENGSVDGIINMFRQDYLQVNLAQSWDTGDSTRIGIYDRSRMYLMWEKRIINGFGYRFSYSSVGQNYIPGLGFEQRYNFSQFGDRIFYSWFAPEKSSLRQTVVTLQGGISFNNSTREPETSTWACSRPKRT